MIQKLSSPFDYNLPTPEETQALIDKINADPEIDDILRMLDDISLIYRHFLYKISNNCTITLQKDYLVKVEFTQMNDNPLLKSLGWSPTIIGDIGETFDTCFQVLSNQLDCILINTPPDIENTLDYAYTEIADLFDLCGFLKTCINRLDNSSNARPDFFDFHVSRSNTNDFVPLLGTCTAWTTDKYGQKLYRYECNNLIQMCFALLDILCRVKFEDKKRTAQGYRMSLRQCPVCHRYFTTTNRKQKICQYENGACTAKSTSESKERSRISNETVLSEAQRREKNIKSRLTSYIADLGNSVKYLDTKKFEEEKKRRQGILALFNSCAAKHRIEADYLQWLHGCEDHLPLGRSGDYTAFTLFLIQ